MVRCIVLIAYCIALLFLAFTRPVALPAASAGSFFKTYHCGAFFLLTLLTLWTLNHRPRGQRLLVATSFAFSFGLLIEAVQQFLPYRSGQWLDLLSNGAGILFGLLFYAFSSRLRRRSHFASTR